MAPTGDEYDVDWIISTSNVHVAKHRDWFVNYRPFKSRTQGLLGGSLVVEGVGDVELHVRKPNRNARPSYSIVRLEDVLYCPGAICNQVAVQHIADGYGMRCTSDGGF